MGYENIEISIEELIGNTTTVECFLSQLKREPFFMEAKTFKYKIDKISSNQIILQYPEGGKMILNRKKR